MNNKVNITPNRLVWWFVAGLPLGLFLMGALSFIFYFQKRHARETPQPSRFAAMLRKDMSLDDFNHYEHTLTQELGERTLSKPENLDAAASFIESTLGLDNMGYAVRRREFMLQGHKLANIEAQLIGTQSPRHLVLIATRYDGKDARHVSAMLCLANAFTGTTHRNTLRFVALAIGDEKDEKNNGAAVYRDWISRTEFDSVTVIMDETLSENAVIKTALKETADAFASLSLPSNVLLNDLQKSEVEIRRRADEAFKLK